MLPILFRYSRIPLDPEPQWVTIDRPVLDDMQGQLATLSNHEHEIYQEMRRRFESVTIDFCHTQDGDDFLRSEPKVLWLPHLSKEFSDFQRFVTQYTLKLHVKSIVLCTDKECKLGHEVTKTKVLKRVVSELWSEIFALLEPTRLVVAAPPTTLAGLSESLMLTPDDWAFEMKMHYLELLQYEPLRVEHMQAKCRPWGLPLVHKRPWYHLGYNEGSSVPAYNTYDFHHKQSHHILTLILRRLAKEAQACCNIMSFSFIAVFPLAAHVAQVVRALQRIPTVNRIHFQLAPGLENSLMSDKERMGRAQHTDLWQQWREGYTALARDYKEYECMDGAEIWARDWDTGQTGAAVEECMNILNWAGLGWPHKGEGKWVREHALDEEVANESEMNANN